MKALPKQKEEKILAYIDGELTLSEISAFEEMLRTEPDIKKRYNELLQAERAMQGTQLEMPSKNFTQIVMGQLHEKQPRTVGLSIRTGLLLFMGIVAVMSIAVVLSSAGVFDKGTTIDLNMNFVEKHINQQLPPIAIDGQWLVKAIILLNLIIAFVLLDRAILKPLFQRRINSPY